MIRSVLVVMLVAVPASARADEFSLHWVVSSQWAGSDTTFEDGTGADFTWSYQLRPGAVFSYNARRHSHELVAETGIDGTGFEREGISLGLRGSFRSNYILTPRLNADTAVNVSGGRTNAFTTTGPANVGGPSILPSNQSEYLAVDANQNLSFVLSPMSNVRQLAFARYMQTV